jgi:putative heme-binding domain-containing protein
MTVPEGFSVELVAAEPNIVNPVSMTFDERGRIWITESLEYPRHDAGPGRDRIKVLESTKGDGVYDRITIFADGLNIPSGIAVGHGGVWVANAPDILFYREGRDGKAAGKPEVVVTGFGRLDTHELPNSLTWGPDGWLYGLNGVFNPSLVKQNGKEFRFTCALFRIHPRTREFQLFCEGTSNPWGIAWDTEGSAFVSACVIDHLWHLTETGYYHRQGGPYPPFVWKLGSIVQHRHQKAAYCGLHFFDSDAYPPEYREKLYMGNIHGNCINCDELTRAGATYLAKPRPDFLTAHDPWFMPVVQKTGPDGCLYILDWYDRYHCYQDARRDPAGIDRDRGRLYRVRYRNTPRAGRFDLAQETDEQLLRRLHHPNVFFRDLAQRLLSERGTPEVCNRLSRLIFDGAAPRKTRLHALWALVSIGTLDAGNHLRLLEHQDPAFRAWGVRAAGNARTVPAAIRDKIVALAADPAPDVQLQVAIAARKLAGVDPVPVLVRVLSACGDDRLIPPIVWANLQPFLEEHAQDFLGLVEKADLMASPGLLATVPRALDRLLASQRPNVDVACRLVALLSQRHADCCGHCLQTLSARLQAGEIAGDHRRQIAERLTAILRPNLKEKPDCRLSLEACVLATLLHDAEGLKMAQQILAHRESASADRLRILSALIAVGRTPFTEIDRILRSQGSVQLRGEVLATLAQAADERVASVVLACYPGLEPELQPRAIELLTQRTVWARQLLDSVARKKVPANALNVNQVQKLLALKDAELTKIVSGVWGTLRAERNPEREQVVASMRAFLQKTPGDPQAGAVVFKNLCAQCHRMHGAGQDVGPDLTLNGRSSFEQLLSNVFDPSLVIGTGYQATIVITKRDKVLTGLVVEDTPQRVVLKQQGGKLESIPRAEVDEVSMSKVSLMPEGLEKQLKPQEIADLFAFLCLDKPPTDPSARRIPGTPDVRK